MTNTNGWRSLKDDPPGPEHRFFFVGSSKGGRHDYVFRWPDPLLGTYWCRGEHGQNYHLKGYTPDVWYPGPPVIPDSFVEAIQQGKLP